MICTGKKTSPINRWILAADQNLENTQIPQLSDQEISDGLLQAGKSPRRRFPNILHLPGDEFNRVVNFILQDSYMQPHLHPGDEKIEKIHLIHGRVATLFFDDQGNIKQRILLEEGGNSLVEVPAFTWHTYVMLSEHAITYETMMGAYDPGTWKKFADWAPLESTPDSLRYLDFLKGAANNTNGRGAT